MSKGDYQAVFFCRACDHQMSYQTKMGAMGVCPFCGHSSGGLVCDTVTRGGRWVYDFYPTWWEWLVLWKGSRGHWEWK